MSNEKGAPGCLGFVGDYTTQLCGYSAKPLKRSLLNNQYFMESKVRFFRSSIEGSTWQNQTSMRALDGKW